MNFSRDNVKRELRKTSSRGEKHGVRIGLLIVKLFLVLLLFATVMGCALIIGVVKGVIDQSPVLTAEDVAPSGLASVVYDSDGKVIQTLVGSGANRTLVQYSDIPQDLINAFVSIEDSRFWTHEGIDVKGIIRAAFVGVTGGFKFTEGASTITQQLIKNNVFDGGQEKTLGSRIVRKIQEQYLAMELEKTISKKEILIDYLNTINLGSNCLGVEKAAQRYFGKSVSELNLSESAVIAAITQNPYAYNPIRFPEKNKVRRAKVLGDMEREGYITSAQKEEALADDVYSRIAEYNNVYQNNYQETVYSYFVDRLIKDVKRDLVAAGYSEQQAQKLIYSGGLQIYSTQDSAIQAVVDAEVNNPDNYKDVEQKYSFTYTLRVVHSDGSYTDYDTNDVRKYLGKTYLDFNKESEIEEIIAGFKSRCVSQGDKIGIEKLDISLQPQVSVTLMDQYTGYVKAIAGGRGEKTASLSLNRATNTFRQPGSTFKVLAAFAPALEYSGDTLATTFYDEPYTATINGSVWTPKNWYSKSKYAGYANIHQAITYSMNIIAAKCLVEDVGIEASFKMLENFGINTLIPETAENKVSGRNDMKPTLALGGITQGVTNMQLTGAFASIANGGTYTEPVLYTKVVTNSGRVILEKKPETHTVISEETAFLLTHAMQSSLEKTKLNGLFNSNSAAAKLSRLPAAGKSGTTNSYNDLWFVGYSPYYTIGVWSGYDDNNKFSTEDERDFHKIIWKNIMEKITEPLGDADFAMPSNIVECEICTKSGLLATGSCKCDPRDCIVEKEYFVKGTEPVESCNLHSTVQVCKVSKLLPGVNCKEKISLGIIKLPEETTGSTQDNAHSSKPKDTCNVCQPTGETTPGTQQQANPPAQP